MVITSMLWALGLLSGYRDDRGRRAYTEEIEKSPSC
jgi:hypothetical protein